MTRWSTRGCTRWARRRRRARPAPSPRCCMPRSQSGPGWFAQPASRWTDDAHAGTTRRRHAAKGHCPPDHTPASFPIPMKESMPDLREAALHPQSIAVIGASGNIHEIGGGASPCMQKHGFAGRIYPIDPAHDEVQGLQSDASLAALPEAPELALLIVGGDKAVAAVDVGGAGRNPGGQGSGAGPALSAAM